MICMWADTCVHDVRYHQLLLPSFLKYQDITLTSLLPSGTRKQVMNNSTEFHSQQHDRSDWTNNDINLTFYLLQTPTNVIRPNLLQNRGINANPRLGHFSKVSWGVLSDLLGFGDQQTTWTRIASRREVWPHLRLLQHRLVWGQRARSLRDSVRIITWVASVTSRLCEEVFVQKIMRSPLHI